MTIFWWNISQIIDTVLMKTLEFFCKIKKKFDGSDMYLLIKFHTLYWHLTRSISHNLKKSFLSTAVRKKFTFQAILFCSSLSLNSLLNCVLPCEVLFSTYRQNQLHSTWTSNAFLFDCKLFGKTDVLHSKILNSTDKSANK